MNYSDSQVPRNKPLF